MTSTSRKASARRPRSLAARRDPSVRTLAVAGLLLAAQTMLDAEAKSPGAVYCHRHTCHRVISLEEASRLVGNDTTVRTSYYDHCRRDRLNPCGLTSSGERVRPGDADNAASPVFPDGTVLLLFNPKTGRAAVVRVNNAGPYWGRRQLDVSRATARSLGFERDGVADLEVRVLLSPLAEDAVYRRHRRYDRVPGFIGTFPSLAHAHADVLDDIERLVEARAPRPRQPSPEQPALAAALAVRETEAATARALPTLRLATRAPDVSETPARQRPLDVASLNLPPLTLDRAPPLPPTAAVTIAAMPRASEPAVMTAEVIAAPAAPLPLSMALVAAHDGGRPRWLDAGRTIDLAIAKARTPGAPLRLPEVAIPRTLSMLTELKARTEALAAALRDSARRGL